MCTQCNVPLIITGIVSWLQIWTEIGFKKPALSDTLYAWKGLVWTSAMILLAAKL